MGRLIMENIIAQALKDSLRVKEDFIKKNTSKLMHLAEYISQAFNNGRKLMICGNGGSAADAQHLAAEFVNRFQLERPPLPALALTTNDYGYEDVFSKQIEALGVKGDILLGLSTSGRSENILSAIRTARERGLYTAGFTGGDGGGMLKLVDVALVVDNNQTPRIQEAHIMAGHLLCELVEYILFQRDSCV